MAYTFRNLILDAYTESGMKGRGMPVTAADEEEAQSQMNLILTAIFAGGNNAPVSATSVTFDGSQNYTIGPVPTLTTDEQPDIEMDIRPNRIDKIIFNYSGVRNIAYPMTPDVYYSRSLDTITNPIPAEFYYEQGNPFGVIRFYEGTPSGTGELIMQPSLTNITANTDFKYFPESLKPYLVTELARAILRKGEQDDSVLASRSLTYWRLYKQSIYAGQAYKADTSAPGYNTGGNKYNIYRGD